MREWVDLQDLEADLNGGTEHRRLENAVLEASKKLKWKYGFKRTYTDKYKIYPIVKKSREYLCTWMELKKGNKVKMMLYFYGSAGHFTFNKVAASEKEVMACLSAISDSLYKKRG